MSLLRVEQLTVHYGHLRVLADIDVAVEEGEVLTVVGANGAGKSTLLRTVAGLVPATRGRVVLAGHDVTKVPAHRRVRAGVSLVHESRRLFPGLTVEENLLVGGYCRRAGPWSVQTVYELFPMIAERARQRAGSLSGGQQQAVAIGRALMANPRLLLLDEVSLGLAPVVVHQLYAAFGRIVDSGSTVLVVEQDLSQALAVADRVVCLLEGQVALSAPAREVSRADVTAAYFGRTPGTAAGSAARGSAT